MKLEDFTKVNRNLYKDADGKYFRLFATGETPNRCWLINPAMRELLDIDIATGKDIYGGTSTFPDVCGTVSICNEWEL